MAVARNCLGQVSAEERGSVTRSGPGGVAPGSSRLNHEPEAPAATGAAKPPGAAGSVGLTRRQTDVLKLLLRGFGNREIALHLGISERTVREHITSLFQKFSVTSRGALIATVLTAAQGGVSHRRLVSARTKARATSARFKAYEKAPFMVAVTLGPEHRYVFCNEIAAQVAGRKRERIVGRSVRQLYPDIEIFWKALDTVHRTGIPWSVRDSPGRYTHEDGTHRDVVLNLLFQPLRDADGVIEGILHLGTEVT